MLLEVVASADTLVGPEDGTEGETEQTEGAQDPAGPPGKGGVTPGPQVANYPAVIPGDSGTSQMLLLVSDKPPH